MARRRRPNVEDRRIADVLRRLKSGEYDLIVEDAPTGMQFSGFARLKTEGMIELTLPDDRTITIIPCRKIKAA